uniref:Uncharacterized protein n=1 Tax=Brassica oleracea TaxID=3712 RepID=A0A3P6HIU4_BRAOL|nr:unnamed protein product [Brassica oleracea]
MVREKVKVSTRTLQWKCVESRRDSKRLYYGRFILSPLMKRSSRHNRHCDAKSFTWRNRRNMYYTCKI